MKEIHRSWCWAFVVAALAAASLLPEARAQQNPPARISFHFERPGVEVPEYTFVLLEDGTATYETSAAQTRPDGSSSRYARSTEPQTQQHISSAYQLPLPLARRLFVQVRAARLSADCASKARNIANTGMKTLTYAGAEQRGSCSFNYSENQSVTALASTFEAMSATLAAGRALAYDERYDRLALDHDMNALVEELKDGRAEAPGLIAPELQSLVADEQVMQRVRRNAAILLDKAPLAH